MKFVKVSEVPRMGYKRNELKAELEDFMAMHTKTVQVVWEGTYKSAMAAASGLYRAVQRWALPITVTRRGDAVYMIRRDM